MIGPNAALFAAIQSQLRAAAMNVGAATRTSKLYEAFVYGTVLEAVRAEGGSVQHEDRNGLATRNIVFPLAPRAIYSREQLFTHAVVQMRNKPDREVHLNVRVTGKSRVLHECDVLVLPRGNAQACRQVSVHPASHACVLSAEAKYRSASLELGEARGFIGLETDLSIRAKFFVSNLESDSVSNFLRARLRGGFQLGVSPSSLAASRLLGDFRTVLAR